MRLESDIITNICSRTNGRVIGEAIEEGTPEVPLSLLICCLVMSVSACFFYFIFIHTHTYMYMLIPYSIRLLFLATHVFLRPHCTNLQLQITEY